VTKILALPPLMGGRKPLGKRDFNGNETSSCSKKEIPSRPCFKLDLSDCAFINRGEPSPFQRNRSCFPKGFPNPSLPFAIPLLYSSKVCPLVFLPSSVAIFLLRMRSRTTPFQNEWALLAWRGCFWQAVFSAVESRLPALTRPFFFLPHRKNASVLEGLPSIVGRNTVFPL